MNYSGNRGRILGQAGWVLVSLLSLLSVAWGQPCVEPPAGLVSWWTGDGHAQDSVGSNHGTVQGSVTFVSGVVGRAFRFPGSTAFVRTPLLLPPVGTIEVWVKPQSLSSLSSVQGIAGTHGTANGDNRLWITSVGPAGGPGVPPQTLAINLGSCCVNDIAIPNPLSVGSWTHIALTFNYRTDVYRLYINGTLRGSATAQRNVPTRPFRMGADTSDFGQNFFFNGVIDEVSVYNRSLAASEIRTIVAAGSGGKCKPRVGGAVTGVSPGRVVCANLTRDQTLTILQEGAKDWDCEAAGLVVRPGDQIRQTIIGPAD